MSSRSFDHNKNKYASEHRNHNTSEPQHTKHYIANNMMEHYGCKPSNYNEFSYDNYRMGSQASNNRDRRIDNAILGEVFSDAGHSGGYDARRLCNNGVNREQQLQAIGNRFDVAKIAYERTGEHKYFMMQNDLRAIAGSHLNADLRGFRLSHKG
jgi:hypothetical protein